MSTPDLFRDDRPAKALPAASRTKGLARLKAFSASMGRHYATHRNFDFGPQDRSNVSGLSAHIRHRLVSEQEVAVEALRRHGLQGAEKFIQEVCWRTYWKGWLEQRPSAWSDYRAERDQNLAMLDTDQGLRARYEAALKGQTGLACFDVWAHELVDTGYLHNHARMWFASIWVYTLELPWALGADFFLRHLMDGDAASNTLGWRWVCGLQTVGKTYLARASNINKYSAGRFSMQGYELAGEAPPLDPDLVHPRPDCLKPADRPDPGARTLVLLHEENLCVHDWPIAGLNLVGLAGVEAIAARSPLGVGDTARAFTLCALEDGLSRAGEALGLDAQRIETGELIERARSVAATQIVTQRAQVGPLRDTLDGLRGALLQAGIALVEMRRDWDRAFHPHADKGFFTLKKKIGSVFDQLNLP